jgi:glycosyltransferase involved in cell wall biosynthesis
VRFDLNKDSSSILTLPKGASWTLPLVNFFVRAFRKLLFLASKAEARLTARAREAQTVQHHDKWSQGIDDYYNTLHAVVPSLRFKPLISVLVPVYKVKPRYLSECLASVAAQIYPNWELCIVDDGSGQEALRILIEEFAASFPGKVHYLVESKNRGICGASQLALGLATGEYTALLDHDDRLLPHALLEVTRAINANGQPDIIFSDEARVNEQGVVEDVFYKPDWSPLFNLTCHYSTHLSVFRTELIRSIGGFRLGFEGSQDHDLMLRAVENTAKPVVHIPLVLYQWRAHPQSTARTRDAKPYAAIAGEKAVSEACVRRGWPAKVEFDTSLERYRVQFELKAPDALTSIIIPSRDGYDLIEPCLRSIFKYSTDENFEIIVVDHQTTCPRCLDLFKRYEITEPKRFRRVPYNGSFNFAVMNNLAVEAAQGAFLLFLNNDTEVKSHGWLREMKAVAQLPNVGAVGAKLLLENGHIQHAGIVGLGSGVAGNAGFGMRCGDKAYYSYLQVMHEVLAVTGACLMLERPKFYSVKGFDEVHVPNGFGDVDLCLRLKEKGLTSVYVPAAVLAHKESPSRKASFEAYERWYMLQRWGHELILDPYLNPNLERSQKYKLSFDALYQQPAEASLQKRLQQAWAFSVD